ncbi:MAG: hypothetical protein KKC18_14505 [Chloroflexi bacterium]|nr:hypothetical protein [Chloroflexota bacterium]
MIKTGTITLILFTTGVILFLVGFLVMPVGAARVDVPALQPSPRPPWIITPTPTPTSPPPTLPPLPTPTPTPIPIPILLPLSGGTFSGGWLLGLGAGFVLLGLTFVALKRGR